MADELAGRIIYRVARLVSGRIVAVDDVIQDGVVLGQLRFLFQSPGSIIFIYALEAELAVGGEGDAAAEPVGRVQPIMRSTEDLAVAGGGNSGRFMVRRIEFVSRARAVGIDRDIDTNRVRSLRRSGLGESGNGQGHPDERG